MKTIFVRKLFQHGNKNSIVVKNVFSIGPIFRSTTHIGSFNQLPIHTFLKICTRATKYNIVAFLTLLASLLVDTIDKLEVDGMVSTLRTNLPSFPHYSHFYAIWPWATSSLAHHTQETASCSKSGTHSLKWYLYGRAPPISNGSCNEIIYTVCSWKLGHARLP